MYFLPMGKYLGVSVLDYANYSYYMLDKRSTPVFGVKFGASIDTKPYTPVFNINVDDNYVKYIMTMSVFAMPTVGWSWTLNSGKGIYTSLGLVTLANQDSFVLSIGFNVGFEF